MTRHARRHDYVRGTMLTFAYGLLLLAVINAVSHSDIALMYTVAAFTVFLGEDVIASKRRIKALEIRLQEIKDERDQENQ